MFAHPTHTRTLVLALALMAPAVLSGCGEDFRLPPATLETEEFTLTLYALTGTPVGTASAYDLVFLSPVRTDRSTAFDFAVDMVTDASSDTVALVIPRGATGLSVDGGVQKVALSYDALLLAPEDGYVEDSALTVDVGDVLAFASRRQNCNFGIARPHYAKALVEAIDRDLRTIQLKVRVDPNCGYRGLDAGLPTS